MILFAVPHVHYFDIFYFIAILGMVALTVASVLLCKKKGKEFTHRFILVLIWANFALHFLKQFLPYYFTNWPYSLSASGAPNLCAFFVLFGPVMYLSKNKYLRDYFFYIGVLSGVLVYFWPTTPVEAVQLDGWTYILECIRFYLCHLLILIAPLVMVTSGLHTLRFNRLWCVPVCFGVALFVIALHCVICGPVLHVPGYLTEWFGPEGILSRQGANESMQFGPQSKFDKSFGFLYMFYFPYLLTFPIEGTVYFVPVLWILPAIYLGAYLIGPAMMFLVDPKGTKLGFLAYRQKRQMRRNARGNKC